MFFSCYRIFSAFIGKERIEYFALTDAVIDVKFALVRHRHSGVAKNILQRQIKFEENYQIPMDGKAGPQSQENEACIFLI